MEEALFVEKERAQVTLNCIGDAVACTDSPGKVTFLNLVAEKMTGWSLQEAAGRPLGEVFRVLDAANREAYPNPMETAIEHDCTAHLPSNYVLVRRDGFEIPIEDSVSPIHDREGNSTGAVIVFRDVSAARAMADQITHSAEHDFLTGLPNRMLLNDRVSQAIALARRHKKQWQCCFWIWTASSTSTIPWAIRSATNFFNPSQSTPGGLRARLGHGEPAGRR